MIRNYFISGLLVFILALGYAGAEEFINLEVTKSDNPAPGYILTGPVNKNYIAIYDNSGQSPYYKSLDSFGQSFWSLRILANGNFAFFNASLKEWYVSDQNFEIIDTLRATAQYRTNFHTLYMSPEGNYMLVADDFTKVDMSQIVENGNKNAIVNNHIVQEFDQNGALVFQWNCLEHISVTNATQDIDLTLGSIDPYHINAAKYDRDGNILLNFRNQDAVYKISRATGDIIWVMGGSKARRNDFTFVNDTRDGFTGFSHQHDPTRLANGNILLYDNGNLKPVQYSRAVEYQVDEISKTVTKVWEYRRTPDVYASFMGNAQRLPNGNTLIGWGGSARRRNNLIGTEVTPDGNVAFEVKCSNDGSYQVLRNVYKSDAVVQQISSPGEYNFNDTKNNTNVTLEINQLVGNGMASIEKHGYAPYNLESSVGACNYLPYRWVLNNQGISSFEGKINISLESFNNFPNKGDLKIFFRPIENSGVFRMIETTFNSTLNRLEANTNAFGEYFLAYTYFFTPSILQPQNEAFGQPLNAVLSWKRNSAKEMYQLQISTNEAFTDIVLDSSYIAGTQINASHLKNLQKYFWRVRSNNQVCESPWSDVRTFTTKIGSPTEVYPQNSTKSMTSSGYVKWTNVSNAEHYRIQISEDPLFSIIDVDKVLTNETTVNYSNFKLRAKYFWRVAAENGGVYGDWSETFNFLTVIGNFNLLQPSNNELGVKVAGKFTWEKMPNVYSVRIQVATDSTLLEKTIDTLVFNFGEFNYSKLLNAHKYFWRVKGFDNDFETSWSEIRSFTTLFGSPSLEYPPNQLTNTPISGTMYWSELQLASSYQVQISKNPEFTDLVINLESSTPSLKYSKLQYSTKYYWRVRGYDGKTTGDWSSVNYFTTHANDFLISPVFVYPPENSYGVSVKPKITWEEAAGAIYYDLQIAENEDFTLNVLDYSSINVNELSVDGLEHNKLYFIRIRSINSKMTSSWSVPNTFTTSLEQPLLQNKFTFITPENSSVNLSWSNVPAAVKYRIQIAKDENFTEIIEQKSEITETSFEFTFESKQADYYWRVIASNDANISDWSENGSVSVNSANSVTDINFIQNISVYPMPVSESARISFKSDKDEFAEINILNSNGSNVSYLGNFQISAGENNINIMTNNLSSGSYFVSMKSGNKIKLIKIVKSE